MKLYEARYRGGILALNNWRLFKVSGSDCDAYIQNHVTNDLSCCKINFAQLNARLDRVGKVQSYFYVGKKEDFYIIIVPEDMAESTLKELEKFIIMEDVSISAMETPQVYFSISSKESEISAEDQKKDNNFLFVDYYGEEGVLFWGEFYTKLFFKFKELIPSSVDSQMKVISGWAGLERSLVCGKIINETILNELAISYSKGCFLGQETVSKIQNNRGASYYPVIVKVHNKNLLSDIQIYKNKNFNVSDRKAGILISSTTFEEDTLILVNLYREFRIEGRQIKIIFSDGFCLEGVVTFLPFFKDKSLKDKADAIYFKGLQLFQVGKEESALEKLKTCLDLFPLHADALESIGVIFGRQGHYEKAINYMDRLLEIDKDSVMAHTNKSLYFMKLGKIEEAEEEKSQAAVKSFAYYGREAKKKKEKEDIEKQELENLKKKEDMFLQVLSIDENDVLANFGLGETYFKKKQLQKALTHLKKVLSINSGHSMAYLVLGKVYEGLGQLKEAEDIYVQGVEVASKKGEMKPANEMQARLSKIN
ncbi:MAG: hypothetical protein CME68_02425 [Halobacteriovoraceae bacterium]|nr:hypothetical protein [Halobacteriovoraceae bacterium]